VLIAIAAWAVYSRMSRPSSADGPAPGAAGSTKLPNNPGVENPHPIDPDERMRRLAIGTWEDDYQGKRTMTLNQDGTATMIVELGGLKAALFASRLKFEMTWSVEKGRLKKRTISGEPAAQVQLILSTMGDRVEEPILQLTEDRLLLQDRDGKTTYDWRRPAQRLQSTSRSSS